MLEIDGINYYIYPRIELVKHKSMTFIACKIGNRTYISIAPVSQVTRQEINMKLCTYIQEADQFILHSENFISGLHRTDMVFNEFNDLGKDYTSYLWIDLINGQTITTIDGRVYKTRRVYNLSAYANLGIYTSEHIMCLSYNKQIISIIFKNGVTADFYLEESDLPVKSKKFDFKFSDRISFNFEGFTYESPVYDSYILSVCKFIKTNYNIKSITQGDNIVIDFKIEDEIFETIHFYAKYEPYSKDEPTTYKFINNMIVMGNAKYEYDPATNTCKVTIPVDHSCHRFSIVKRDNHICLKIN